MHPGSDAGTVSVFGARRQPPPAIKQGEAPGQVPRRPRDSFKLITITRLVTAIAVSKRIDDPFTRGLTPAMDGKTYWTLVVSVLLAFLGWIAKYWSDARAAARKAQLDYLNAQLSELYGPLLALEHASTTIWERFRKLHRPESPSYFSSLPAPTEDDLAAWRLWMQEVFMPLNLQMEATILARTDLIEGDNFPPCFHKLLAHVAGYKPVFRQWASGDFSDHTSVIDYPKQELQAHIHESYGVLSSRRKRLLALVARKRR
jgi:hypothetical protein